MPAKGIQPIVSEYNVMWEALKHYKERLERMASMATDEDQQLKYDEKVQDIDGILSALRVAAKSDHDLELR